jgi:hypothetical protein
MLSFVVRTEGLGNNLQFQSLYPGAAVGNQSTIIVRTDPGR